MPIRATRAPMKGGRPEWRLPGSRSTPVPYIAYEKGSFPGAVVDHLLSRRRTALEDRHMDAFAEALKSLTLTGAGVAWLPERSARALESSDLVLVGDDGWIAESTLSVFAAPEHLDRTGREIWQYFTALSGRSAGRP